MSASWYQNRSLFSDYYLAERLPQHREWREDVGAVWAEARALYALKRAQLPGMNEAQTEEEWVKPILTRILGWSYSVQTDATLFGRVNRPDYALFTGEEAKQAAQRQGAGAQLDYRHAAAVGDAKFWGRPLDTPEVRAVLAKLLAAGLSLSDFVGGQLYRGILTGLNEAFIVDHATYHRLIRDDPTCAPFLKPMVRGEDLRPWYQEDEGRWLIALPHGWTCATFGERFAEEEAWEKFSERHPALTEHLAFFTEAARARHDKGQYWWELRACDYYEVFSNPKLFWPDIAKYPRFSVDETGAYCNDKGFLAVSADRFLLGVLQSRASWFAVSRLCTPLGEREGSIRYQQKIQFISRLPIPTAPPVEREAIGALAIAITEQARARYALHRRVRRRILSDLGAPGRALNQKLTAWWELDFPAFRTEARKALKNDIPLRERDEWDEWLTAQRVEHERHTAEIVRLETELNARMYALFDLTPEEIRIIEESTKYSYGEV